MGRLKPHQFKDEINQINFFWWDKKLIEGMNWAELPPASKSVFPVIVCHCNKKGIAFPSEGTISALCGRTEKIVRSGINGLDDFPNFKGNYYITSRGQRSRKFYYTIPNSRERGRCFPFHKWIIESGLWQKLKPTAQALYPVMRNFANFDTETCFEVDNIVIEDDNFDEYFKTREADYCDAEKNVLADYADIALSSLSSALDNLEENYLIESTEDNDIWKVYLKSKDMFYIERDLLNNRNIESTQTLSKTTD